MELTSSDSELPTTSLLKLALEIYDKGEIDFNSQNTFKNREWFLKEIENLVKFGKVEKTIYFTGSHGKINPHYKLNPAGKIWVELFIINYLKRVKK